MFTSRAAKSVCEFTLAADLPGLVLNKIAEEISTFPLERKLSLNRNNPVRLEIACFRGHSETLPTIIRWIQRILQNHLAFELAINNYTCVPDRGLCLRIMDASPIENLARDLQVVNIFLEGNNHAAIRCTCPKHLAISQTLSGNDLFQTALHFSQRSFYEKVPVNEIKLIQQAKGGTQSKLINLFMLKNITRAIAS